MVDYLANEAIAKKNEHVVEHLVSEHIPILQTNQDAFKQLITKIDLLKNECYNINLKLQHQDSLALNDVDQFFKSTESKIQHQTLSVVLDGPKGEV